MKSIILTWLTQIHTKAPFRLRLFIEHIVLKFNGGYMYSCYIRKIYKKAYGITIGYGTYGGCFNPTQIPRGTVFGNYCSIAQNIRIFRANHPLDEFTTHPLLYNPIAGYVERDMLKRPPIVIGNDVWIGEWAIILPNVKYIGNGAIIGAGAVVTKDVPPYTVVGGNPAKEIKKRFDHDQINILEESKWWNLNKSELIRDVISTKRFKF